MFMAGSRETDPPHSKKRSDELASAAFSFYFTAFLTRRFFPTNYSSNRMVRADEAIL